LRRVRRIYECVERGRQILIDVRLRHYRRR
jgi:hypothetical protein